MSNPTCFHLSASCIAAFKAKTTPVPPSTCWLWTGCCDKQGRGKVQIGGRCFTAPRIAYLIAYGVWPGSHYVLHRCDTPACVNPDHLSLGSQYDNMREMRLRTRRVCEKLTPELAAEIRQSNQRGVDLARQYAVSQGLISMVKKGQVWI